LRWKLLRRPPSLVAAAAPAPAIPDDLEIIEGIGPKIAGVFREAGINTFAQLAATPVETLREILQSRAAPGRPHHLARTGPPAAAGDLMA
jgi:predicted flap endonuclease-1-like 5' DNA nuclease